MNFTNLVLEALGHFGVIRDATKMDLEPYQEFIGDDKVVGAWVLNHKFLAIEFGGSNNYMIYKDGRYEGYSSKHGEIGKEIKNWELKKNLTPDTLDTFQDIMTESEAIDYDSITFHVTGKGWMDNRTGNLSTEKIKDSTEVFCLKDSLNGTWWLKTIPYGEYNEPQKERHFRVIQAPRWYNREKGGYRRGVERHGFTRKIQRELAPKLVADWEFKQLLSSDTRDTFDDLFGEGWKREKFVGLGPRLAKPIKPHITKHEQDLLDKWRQTLKEGDRVDIIDIIDMRPGVVEEDVPISHFITVGGREGKIAAIPLEGSGFRMLNLDFLYPPGYMPGDMIKSELTPDTLDTFQDLI